jgi:GDP-L-fucose synthase
MGLSKAQYRSLCAMKPGQPPRESETGEHAPRPTVSHVNVGTGKDVTIKDLAAIVKSIVGYPGEETWDHSKPDGTPRKLLDISRLQRTDWKPRIDLKDGIRSTYQWYCNQIR